MLPSLIVHWRDSDATSEVPFWSRHYTGFDEPTDDERTATDVIGLVALICLGFAWAVDDDVFATVFAIEASVAAWGFEESKGG